MGCFWGLIFGPGIFWGFVGSPRDFWGVLVIDPIRLLPPVTRNPDPPPWVSILLYSELELSSAVMLTFI